MRRYGTFVDSIWIHQRMNAKDARVAQRMAAQAERRQVQAIVARLAAVYTVDTDQAALISLVSEARALVQQWTKDGVS